MWNEEQLVRGLIHQHLKAVAPSLAVEFQERHWCSPELKPRHMAGEIQKKILAVTNTRGFDNVEDEGGNEQEQNEHRKKNTFATEDHLVKGLIHEHLKTVAPSLAVEFKVEDKSEGKQEQNNNRKRIGMKMNTYSEEEIMRIKKAMANEEDLRTVAKEMGRTYCSVRGKSNDLRRFAGLKKGKFSAQEVDRIKQALDNDEDYKSVATELNRNPSSVSGRMFMMNYNSETLRKSKSFTFEEDVHILDKMIPRIKFQKLSSAGFLPKSEVMELAKELHRNGDYVRQRWGKALQPWLLQHYTGTTGFRIERMLTGLVAEKFSDHRGIDWSELVNQHKEFVGHTSASISQIYRKILARAKEGRNAVSLQEVAEYAATVYQPGNEKKEPASRVVHREKIILYFKESVAELGINVVV